MIEALISSKTRIKLLLKFFLNSNNEAYLRGLHTEFGESTNGIRVELNRFLKAGLLSASSKGNKKYFKANTDHPLFNDIHKILLKYVGIETIISKVINRLGNVEMVYLVGDISKGSESPIIDLLIIGHVDKTYLIQLIEKAESMIDKKVRYMLYKPSEWIEYKDSVLNSHALLIYNYENKIGDNESH
jgi:predicted nucleotidyltransferase